MDKIQSHIRFMWSFCSRAIGSDKVELAIPNYKDMCEAELCTALWQLCQTICEADGKPVNISAFVGNADSANKSSIL